MKPAPDIKFELWTVNAMIPPAWVMNSVLAVAIAAFVAACVVCVGWALR